MRMLGISYGDKQVKDLKSPIDVVRTDLAHLNPLILYQSRHIDTPTTERKRSPFATISIILIGIGVIIVVGSFMFMGNSNSLNSPSYFYPTELVIAGIFIAVGVLYLGFLHFSNHIMVANTPIVKMDAASASLGILEGKFESESGNTIVAPLSKAKCTFYDIYLFAYYKVKLSITSDIIIRFLSSTWKGEATYLTDGTGYTAIWMNYVENFVPKYNIYRLYDNTTGKPIKVKHKLGGLLLSELAVPNNVTSLSKMLEDARDSGADLSIDSITGGTGISLVPVGNKKKAIKPGYYYIMESYLPIDQTYAAAGYIEHTDKTLRGKPVNVMERDTANTNLFSMVEGQKSSLSKKEFRKSIFYFASAAVILLLLAWLAPINSMYSCFLLITNNSGTYCHYINGSTIALSTQAPGLIPITVTTIPTSTLYTTTIISGTPSEGLANCGALNLSTMNFSTTLSSTCKWNGGNVTIYAAGGDSGYVAYTIIGADGKIYAQKSTTIRCATSMGSVYLPAQNYTVKISTGGGGGWCGPAGVILSG